VTYKVRYSSKFQKDLKRMQKRGLKLVLLTEVIKKLVQGEKLPLKNKDHPLIGNFAGCRECHIKSDWLLIYEIDLVSKILYLVRTGTHNDLFE
jgi:mRNA interferase YafQ